MTDWLVLQHEQVGVRRWSMADDDTTVAGELQSVHVVLADSERGAITKAAIDNGPGFYGAIELPRPVLHEVSLTIGDDPE